jgi:acyl-CoA thioesterase
VGRGKTATKWAAAEIGRGFLLRLPQPDGTAREVVVRISVCGDIYTTDGVRRPSGDPSMTFWMRFADGREPDLLSLPFLVDAAYPAVMEIGELPSATIELTVHLRDRPAPGWLACQINTRHIAGGFHEEDCNIWDTRGVLVAQSRQLAIL